MPSARVDRTPAGRRRLLRSCAVASAVAASALLSAVLPGSVALADEAAGATVVGELVQAWPETGEHGAEEAHEPVSWVETADGEAVPVVTGDVDGVPAGSTVSVTVGGQVDAGDSGEAHEVLDSEVIEAPQVLPAPAGPVSNQVTVVMVAPAGTPAGSRTALQQVVDLVDGPVAEFWAGETRGAVRLAVTAAHDWITTAAGCGTAAQLWNEAAATVGFVAGPGKHLLLYVPPTAPGCAYALAEVGSSLTSGGRLYVRDSAASVIAHELGHNFGLAHSSGLQCDGGADAGACRTTGYRDYYDVMGASWAELGSLNVLQAAQLGVLPAQQTSRVPVTAAPTTVTLAPVSGTDGVRALNLVDGDGVAYWLEYRPAAARDAWLGSAGNRFGLEAGVLLRRADRFPDTSLLLDATPGPAAGWDDDFQASLPVGAPVSLSGGDFTVVVRSTSAAGAQVEVVPSGVPTPGPAAPAGSGSFPPGTTLPGEAGTAVTAPAAPAAGAPAVDGASALTRPDAVRAEPATASQHSPVESGTGTTFLVLGAGCALAGTLLVAVRTLRRRFAR